MRVFTALAVISLAVGVAHSARADARIDTAKLCTTQIPKHERLHGIPAHLLSAISLQESGRYHEALKMSLPWPWTINAEGRGYYFETKQEAVQAAKNLKARGVKSMDLGCMQVNTYHHPHAFTSVEDAFEPARNVAYAASFLRSLYDSEGSWKEAAAAYHSKTPERGAQYVSGVFNRWKNILARLNMPNDVVTTASLETKNPLAKMPVAQRRLSQGTSTNLALPARQTTVLAEQLGKQLPKQEPVRMKIIQVSKISRERDNGIMVVRPSIANEVASNARVINVASLTPAASGTVATTSGPRFIFND